MKKLVCLSLSLAALSSCTTTSPQANAVQVVGSPQAVAGCKYVKSVKGDQNLIGGVMFQGAAYNDAINQMKQKTYEAGANRLYVVNATSGLGGANAIGDAYKC